MEEDIIESNNEEDDPMDADKGASTSKDNQVSPDSVDNTANGQQVVTKEITTEVKCCWCLQRLSFKDRPKLLECFHSCCESCLSQEKQKINSSHQSCSINSLLSCPICKQNSSTEFIIENVFMIDSENADELTDEESENKTSEDEKNEKCSNDCDLIASSYCVDCSALICENCVAAHRRLKITKDHTMKLKEFAKKIAEKGKLMLIKCESHPNENLSVYCKTCDRLTCRDCQLMEHRDHTYMLAKEMVDETRTHLEDLLNSIKFKKDSLSKAVNDIEARKQIFESMKDEILKDVQNQVTKIINAATERVKKIILNIDQFCTHKIRNLDETHQTITDLQTQSNHCVDFVEKVLNGSGNAMLYSKKTLLKNLSRLKEERVNIPNPDHQIKFEITWPNIPVIINEISRSGTFLVNDKEFPPNLTEIPQTHPNMTRSPHQIEIRMQQQQQQQQQPLGPSTSGVYIINNNQNRPNFPVSSPQFYQRNFPRIPSTQPHVVSSTTRDQPSMANNYFQDHLRNQNIQQLNQARMNYAAGGSGPPPPQEVPNVPGQQVFRPSLVPQQRRMVDPLTYSNIEAAKRPLRALIPRQPAVVIHPQQPNQFQKNPAQVQPTFNASASWHIPQQNSGDNLTNVPQAPSNCNQVQDKFKIALKSPVLASKVTSTNPNTPPLVQKGVDNVGESSIKDILETIQKLHSPADSNKSSSPHVHSSTGLNTPPGRSKSNDPNEDWCASCMDGGELMCCDNCPKVFHPDCHIPEISPEEGMLDTWNCLMCFNFDESPKDMISFNVRSELSPIELKKIHRILLELFCEYDLSQKFRELPNRETNQSYYQNVNNPISLSCIRKKLDTNHDQHYKSVQSFIDDCRQLFTNAFLYFKEDKSIRSKGVAFEKFFEGQVDKLFPEYKKSSTLRDDESLPDVELCLDDILDVLDKDDDEMMRRNDSKRQKTSLDE
ncbi:CLUMA_CG003377, isoform A [Clunio marinus]|uniref:CLUMA_CG003377, isoform A n=1 Tax=Clunio marinus TaxID=568069 RepID=A0A1J1HQ87_9DIPT|nr:CLUMA_CG003377, isoform A [Clunio marinus]